ncbi:MAG: hypothetical protein J4F28_02025 [Nitrosopumilaceae archaeon]|nr:hypothetical protein [Nitrosopumilaceae archaeon]
MPTWFVVAAAGHENGAPKRTFQEAWKSWNCKLIRTYGNIDRALAAEVIHKPVLLEADSRRAAYDADISDYDRPETPYRKSHWGRPY